MLPGAFVRRTICQYLSWMSWAGVLACLALCALAGSGRITTDQSVALHIAVLTTIVCGFLVMAAIILQICAWAEPKVQTGG